MIQLPKKITSLLFFVFFSCSSGFVLAQPAFTISNTVCVGKTLMVTAATGTFAASSYTWSSTPASPVFSSPNSTVCDIYFPAAGTYTIYLAISNGTATSSASHTVVVYPLPVLTLSSSASPLCMGDGATLTAGGASSYTWNPTAGLYFLSNSVAYVSPNLTTGYSVTGTSSLGCVNSTAFTITVNSYPNLVLNASSTSICIGATVSLTALGAANYTWTSTTFSGTVHQPTLAAGPGTYSLIGANGFCKDSTSLTISLLAPLSINVSASRGSICKDDGDSLVPVYLNAAGATAYSWTPYYPGQMSYSIGPSVAVTPTVSTIYTVTGTTDVCSGMTTIYVRVESCTVLEERETDAAWTIFPNPVQDKLFIRSKNEGFLNFKLSNLSGEVVLSETRLVNENDPEEVTVNDLPGGIYLLFLSAKGETTRILRVVKH